MKTSRIFQCVWIVVFGLGAATLFGCNSKSNEESNSDQSQQIGHELKSLGGRSTGVLDFDMKCKSHGSKLYWILGARQTVLGTMGIGGYSGDDAAEMAERILKEFQSTTRIESKDPHSLDSQNKIKIEFVDSNGFTVANSVTNKISYLDADGKNVDPLRQGWYYRGEIDINSSEISRISSYQLRADFSEGMNTLLNEASVLVEKKKTESK